MDARYLNRSKPKGPEMLENNFDLGEVFAVFDKMPLADVKSLFSPYVEVFGEIPETTDGAKRALEKAVASPVAAAQSAVLSIITSALTWVDPSSGDVPGGPDAGAPGGPDAGGNGDGDGDDVEKPGTPWLVYGGLGVLAWLLLRK